MGLGRCKSRDVHWRGARKSSGAEVNCRRAVRIVGGASAQLAAAVVAPAPDATSLGNGARVIVAERYGCRACEREVWGGG